MPPSSPRESAPARLSSNSCASSPALPAELEERFDDELRELETETKMRYVTSIERRSLARGMERGMEQGIVQGETSVLKRQLKRRFERLPAWVEERFVGASREELERWADRVITAESLEDVFALG